MLYLQDPIPVSRWYRKISKINPGAYIFHWPFFEGLIFGGAYILRGLSTERNLRFKIDWASLIVRSKFTVFALFYFVFDGNCPSTSPQGLIFRGAIWRRVFSVTGLGGLYLEGLIHGGACFRNFTVLEKGRVQRSHKTIPSTKGMTLITVQELTSTMPSLSPFWVKHDIPVRY